MTNGFHAKTFCMSMAWIRREFLNLRCGCFGENTQWNAMKIWIRSKSSMENVMEWLDLDSDGVVIGKAVLERIAFVMDGKERNLHGNEKSWINAKKMTHHQRRLIIMCMIMNSRCDWSFCVVEKFDVKGFGKLSLPEL